MKAIIYIESENGTKYYYTDKGYNDLEVTTNPEKAKMYNTFQGARCASTRKEMFHNYCTIKGFKRLVITTELEQEGINYGYAYL